MFKINQDNDMLDIAIRAFRQLDNKKDAYYVYKLTSAFYHLAKFNNPAVVGIIKEYVTIKNI